MKLKIAYFYPQELNLYGDTGNVEILYQRVKQRKISAEVITVDSSTKVTQDLFSDIDLIFMGGGPDSGQKDMYQDLLKNKGPYLKEYIEKGGVALFICGSYQLMGKYYKSSDGEILEGLGVFDFYTQHFGHDKPRSVGNVVASLSKSILSDETFKKLNPFSEKIIGFENHGGQTFLGENTQPLAQFISGFGNNMKDKTEGIHYKNALGSYFHGPFLSKNPHIADFLLAKSLSLEKLSNLDDNMIYKAHSALKNRFR